MLRRRSLVAAATGLFAIGRPKAASLTPLKIGHSGAQVFRLPLYVALLNGYFAEQGIDLQVIETSAGSDADKMLAGGSIEFNTSPVIDSVNLNRHGIHAVGVAAFSDRFNNSIIVPRQVQGINSMADLKGQIVAVTGVGSGTWQFALYMATQFGLKPDDLTIVSVGTGAAILATARAGRVAAISFADPEDYQLVAGGDARFLVDATDDATHRKYLGETALFNHVFTTQAFIDKHPDQVQRFVNAIQQAIVWCNAHSVPEVAGLISAYPAFARLDPKLLQATLQRSRAGWPGSAVMAQQAVDNTLKIPVAIGVLDKPPPFSLLIDNRFAEQAASQFR